jgi:uncharacterized membrane protein YphA (DoxX/SURF4 family)
VTLAAAIPKLRDLRASELSVALYQIFPPAINQIIGVALPIIEVTLALLFVSGLLTRYASVVFGLMLVAFIAGIASAWARGLSIDCGCFSPGGALAPGEEAQYGLEILRDIGFMAMVAFLMIWPRSVASVDNLLGLNPRSRADIAAELVPPEDALDEVLEDQEEADAALEVSGTGQAAQDGQDGQDREEETAEPNELHEVENASPAGPPEEKD